MTRRTPVDAKAFDKLKRIAPALLSAQREQGRVRAVPDEVSFKLTNRCNLRCDHCYEWSDDGYHHQMDRDEQRGDLDLAVIARVLDATREIGSNVYLWGGEPLVYRHWDGLVELLSAHRRWTSMCTNGMLIEKRLPSLLRLSERLEVVVALDGFEVEHDALRGEGTFASTLGGVRRLVAEKRAGRFLGEVTVNCVFSDALVGRIHDLVRFLEGEGVDTVYLSYPWHLSREAASRMDAYVDAHLPRLTLRTADRPPSWHAYTFTLDAGSIEPLRRDLARVDGADWRIKVRYNPELCGDELASFLAGSDEPAGGRTRCNALGARLDVLPNGEAVSCKFFPEFTMGNLGRSEVGDVWHGPRYRQVRETLTEHGLMPVCAKCPMLYTRGS